MTKALSLHPDKLRPNAWNSNVMSPENEAKLDEAIKRFGFFKPIIVREVEDGYEILGGEHRWQSARRLGLKSIPVMNLGKIDDQRAMEISLADNARYGVDDAVSLSQLLSQLDSVEDLQDFLPYTDSELRSIFTSTDIALDDLELDEEFDASDTEVEEPPVVKAPKTHTIMRFKVTLADAEKITALITRIQKTHGLTESDALTNAGDALIHLLFAHAETPEEVEQ